jgi:hypothetical protein
MLAALEALHPCLRGPEGAQSLVTHHLSRVHVRMDISRNLLDCIFSSISFWPAILHHKTLQDATSSALLAGRGCPFRYFYDAFII